MRTDDEKIDETITPPPAEAKPKAPATPEIGGRGELEPTRFGDWEIGGKCVDF